MLVPQPSASVNDPLNWPQWRKHFVYLQVLIFTFFTNASIGGLSPGFYILSLEFNKSINTTSGLLTWPILTLGLGVGQSLRESAAAADTITELLLGTMRSLFRKETSLRNRNPPLDDRQYLGSQSRYFRKSLGFTDNRSFCGSFHRSARSRHC